MSTVTVGSASRPGPQVYLCSRGRERAAPPAFSEQGGPLERCGGDAGQSPPRPTRTRSRLPRPPGAAPGLPGSSPHPLCLLSSASRCSMAARSRLRWALAEVTCLCSASVRRVRSTLRMAEKNARLFGVSGYRNSAGGIRARSQAAKARWADSKSPLSRASTPSALSSHRSKCLSLASTSATVRS
eukprot:233195-Prymnesium_polylepis.1